MNNKMKPKQFILYRNGVKHPGGAMSIALAMCLHDHFGVENISIKNLETGVTHPGSIIPYLFDLTYPEHTPILLKENSNNV